MPSSSPDPPNPQRVLVNGLAATAKLLELRIEKDIATAEARLQKEQSIESSIERKGVINSVLLGVSAYRQGDHTTLLSSKREWYREWRTDAWGAIEEAGGNVAYLKQKPLKDCISSFATAAGRYAYYQQFTLLQDVMMTPIYGGDGRLNRADDLEVQARFVATRMGFQAERGVSILMDSQRFIDQASCELNHDGTGTVVVAAGVTCAAVMFIAAPHIGGLIGGMCGLHGAAAMGHGLAVLGGGPLAAGGFGIAGGIKVLLVGGGLVGSGVGYTVAEKLCRQPIPAVIVSMAKLMNFVRYLDSLENKERAAEASELRRDTVDGFMDAKSRLERHGLSRGLQPADGVSVSDNVRVMHVAYEQLATRIKL